MNLFTFSNRASRSEYWGIMIASGILFFLIQLGIMANADQVNPSNESLMGVLVVAVIAFWIQLAVMARRCTDAAMSKWTMLLIIVPLVGLIYTIVLGCVKPDATVDAWPTKAAFDAQH